MFSLTPPWVGLATLIYAPVLRQYGKAKDAPRHPSPVFLSCGWMASVPPFGHSGPTLTRIANICETLVFEKVPSRPLIPKSREPLNGLQQPAPRGLNKNPPSRQHRLSHTALHPVRLSLLRVEPLNPRRKAQQAEAQLYQRFPNVPPSARKRQLTRESNVCGQKTKLCSTWPRRN